MTRSYANASKRKGRLEETSVLSTLVVRSRPGRPTQGLISAGGAVFPCALGRGGVSARKREGDGATPLAAMRLLGGYFRRGRLSLRGVRLDMTAIEERLGWCEVPADRNYNRPVRLPYRSSHERMLRPDRLYDACLVLDWNICPRRRNRGSAIFLHLARPGFTPTEGCVAVTPAVMRRLLPFLTSRTVVVVKR